MTDQPLADRSVLCIIHGGALGCMRVVVEMCFDDVKKINPTPEQ